MEILPFLLFTRFWWIFVVLILFGLCFMDPSRKRPIPVRLLIYSLQSILFTGLVTIASTALWICIFIVITFFRFILLFIDWVNYLFRTTQGTANATAPVFEWIPDWMATASIV